MLELTIPQKNIWNLQKYFEDTSISNISGLLIFDRILDTALLEQSVNRFIQKHDAMRLRFQEEGGQVYQYVIPYHAHTFPVYTYGSMEEAREELKNRTAGPFDMTEAKMWRISFFQTPEKSGLCICFNHMIADAWSAAFFCGKVMEYYRAFAENKEIKELTYSYADFAMYEKEYPASKRYLGDKEYWEKCFEQKPVLCQIKPEKFSSDRIEAGRIFHIIEEELTDRIRRFARQENVSFAVLFEAAVFAYLHRMNPECEKCCIGMLVLNRTGKSAKNTFGMFVSTLPLSVSVEAEDSISGLLEKIAQAHMQVFRHQQYPYDEILKYIRKRHDYQGALFDVIVSYQNASIAAQENSPVGYGTEWFANGYSEVPVVLHIDDRDAVSRLSINLDYQKEMFREEEARLLLNRILYIVEQMVDSVSLKVKQIQVMPKAEYNRMILEFNDTSADSEENRESWECVHKIFERQVENHPQKPAVIFENIKMTYSELNRLSNQIAHGLIGGGVEKNSIVAMKLHRNQYLIPAIIGILKTGAAYLPVDPNYPEERIRFMLQDANAGTVIDEKKLLELISNENVSNPEIYNNPEDAYYCIYTSGSTGKPKGCVLTHRGIANFCMNIDIVAKYRELGIEPVGVSVNNVVFDVFIAETVALLLNGFTTVLCNEQACVTGELFWKECEKNGVNLIQTTPTKFKLLFLHKSVYAKQIQLLAACGEELTQELLDSLKEETDAPMVNAFGPTETCVWSSSGEVEHSDITIGKPIANTQIYILDMNRAPQPIGVPGELCIAGAGVGKGYLNRPELTAEKFVPNPFATEENGHGKVMYRTGDLAAWRADGEIEYLGRIDTQVKIRGLRIELGEIENVMHEYPGMVMCVVADKKDENGRQYLTGYYKADKAVDKRELRSSLAKRLPAYMIPNYFMELERFPMTASGKLDRKSLPVPEFSGAGEEYIALQTQTEQELARIYSRLLQVEQIGRNADFMLLGGDSLRAMELLAEVEDAFSVKLDMKTLLQNTSLGSLAGIIDKSGKNADSIQKNSGNSYLLTPQQQAIYLACEKNPESLAYNMPMFILLKKQTNLSELKKRIIRCYENHPSLCTAIGNTKDGMMAVVKNLPLEFETFERKEDFVRPFVLSHAPLVRVGFGEGGMAVDFHHIICDGESVNHMAEEILTDTFLPERAAYMDYAADFWKKKKTGYFKDHREFYRKQLQNGKVPLCLPEQSVPEGKDDGKSYGYVLSDKSVKAAEKFLKERRIGHTCLFFGLYGMLLSRFSGQEEFLTSIILSNRNHGQIQNTVGMFVNTIPYAFYIKEEDSFTDYMERMHADLLNLYQYQELPMFEICDAAGITDKKLIDTTFVFQTGEARLHDLPIRYIDTHTSKMNLSFQVIRQTGNAYRLQIEYNADKYSEKFIKTMCTGYETMLMQLLEQKKCLEIYPLSDKAYHSVVNEYNQTGQSYENHLCVHQLFEKQADIHGAKTALYFQDRAFTYKELDEMSNSLAHILRDKGVKPNDIVPIIARRSYHVIVAMLGIMKAGGAYLPIDPDYPLERVEYMLRETGAAVAAVSGYHENISVDTIPLDRIDYRKQPSRLQNVTTPEDLCYVIYTSGSTGQPKGALLKHQGLVNFVISNSNIFHLTVFQNCSVTAAIGAFTFDISIVEIFQPLLNGLTVALADDDTANDAKKLAEMICKNRVDFFHATPTRIAYLMKEQEFCKAMKQIRVILSAGEMLPKQLLHSIRKYSDARLFNGYGPTETTVGASFSEVSDAEHITIGKPIANVQIYIVDKMFRPCPVGVSGEICIAGNGVGKGYLNRPMLTEEKFVPNPFATVENGHGKMMYRTGDRAAWEADGEIEYLGRMDTQVKIRGLRIELGEIENVMGGFPGIHMCVVAEQKDEDGRQYLAGYYNTKSDGQKPMHPMTGIHINETELREYMLKKLPRYMVPNFFMHLPAIPTNASGKIDRKDLPVPKRTLERTEYVPPADGLETLLCKAMEAQLKVGELGVTENFFELGCDSLSAVSFVADMAGQGVDIHLQMIYDNPTIRSLAEKMEKGTGQTTHGTLYGFAKAQKEDFSDILKLNQSGQEETDGSSRPFHTVLLTGATGFLGVHLLEQLLIKGTDTIYCLLRSDTDENAKKRLENTLDYYFDGRYKEEIGRKIVALTGDLTDSSCYARLPKTVDCIIHSAAVVKHYGDYDAFEKVNVYPVQELISYAGKIQAHFCYISTMSVSGRCLLEKAPAAGGLPFQFDESCYFVGQNLDNVYIRSKYEAEKWVLRSKQNGADVSIMRVGNLTNRYRDMRFQPNREENAFWGRMRTMTRLQCYAPMEEMNQIEFSPVDCAAEAIVNLVCAKGGKQWIFHVYNHRAVPMQRLLAAMEKYGCHMETVSVKALKKKLLTSDGQAYKNFANELIEAESVGEYRKVIPESSMTVCALRKNGFEWNEIEEDYLDRYVTFIMEDNENGWQ